MGRDISLIATAAAAAGLAACAADFWAMDPPAEIPLDPALAEDLFITTVEVRSTFYNPPDSFSDAFIPAFLDGAACFAGAQPARAIVFIHELDRHGDLIGDHGRVTLPGSVDLHDARGRVIARYPLRADLAPTGGDLTERRTAAAEAFGERLCERVKGIG